MVQVKPSLHTLPIWPGVLGQLSSALQMPSPSLSGRAVPVHAPLVHWSFVVHGLPSSQVPGALVCTHPNPSTHALVVHGLLSLQTTGVPAHTQLAFTTSLMVQVKPSVHGLPITPYRTGHSSTLFGMPSQSVSFVHWAERHEAIRVPAPRMKERRVNMTEQVTRERPSWELPPNQQHCRHRGAAFRANGRSIEPAHPLPAPSPNVLIKPPEHRIVPLHAVSRLQHPVVLIGESQKPRGHALLLQCREG